MYLFSLYFSLDAKISNWLKAKNVKFCIFLTNFILSDGQGHSYDLSPLALDSKNWEVDASTQNQRKTFYINVCRSLVQQGGPCESENIPHSLNTQKSNTECLHVALQACGSVRPAQRPAWWTGTTIWVSGNWRPVLSWKKASWSCSTPAAIAVRMAATTGAPSSTSSATKTKWWETLQPPATHFWHYSNYIIIASLWD